ncbi:fungal-specific transcription factor domain-containing protein [Daldinia loculata]|uniref:fungal-specific transcription factor domain-containing protein n=1 Tax=Daldinia loculata TaxID=103429 RepID=UPI0020C4D6A8|nr:fungal-specific transcription factor domain-containing protein [Daldinia loculata]KAI1642258.1 fungal-specific transcription factor domain-containing protein [Daldinia loculata]
MSQIDPSGSSPDTNGTGQGISLTAPASGKPAAQRKPTKRERVALACQRCKTRKQKCDGQRPACASCARLSLKCVYIVPLVPAAGEKKIYIRALENRIAELEAYLTSIGHRDVENGHLGRLGLSTSSSQNATVTPVNQHNQAPAPVLEQVPRDDEDDSNDILLAVRDLSLSASGHYIGASSNITIGRVLSSFVHSQKSSISASHEGSIIQIEDNPAPKSIYSTTAGDIIGVPFLSPQVAARLLHGYFRHIATRYPVLHSTQVVELHNNRDNLTDEYEQAILHLVYAVSGRWLESAGEMGHFFSDHHYDLAFEELEPMLRLRDSRTINYLLLMALYCTRAPRDPGAWTYVGAAVRLCIELGLHRRQRRQQPSVEGEMDKRRFWTAYFLDRDISIAVGRPPSISDRDIDAELPLDINEDIINDEVIRQAATRVSNIPANPPNTLTSFIHRTRLKQIESEIQHDIYRVDRPSDVSDDTINAFLDRLNAWKSAIPFDTTHYVHRQENAYEGAELYTLHYYRCVRFLLYPQLAKNPVNVLYLKTCADACIGIITDYRRLHHAFPIGFSALSIQSVFLAGLTLIYCAWLAPSDFISVEGSLTDCQILLYIVTERYPSARKYRDVFERIKSAIMGIIAQGKHEPRNPVHIDPNVQKRFANFEGQWAPGMGADFSYMVNTMTGNVATEPPFNLGLDPATVALAGQSEQPTSDLGQYGAVWPDMQQTMSHELGDMNGLGGIYQ